VSLRSRAPAERRLKGGLRSGLSQGLAEHDFDAAGDRGLGGRTDLGGKQNQQCQDDSVAGDG
jgi:hypothetical protein